MTITTRAALLTAAGKPLELVDLTLRAPGPGEVLVRTETVGLCGTDLHFAAGRIPYRTPTVLGHEAAGVVAETGPGVTGLKAGDRVIVCDRMYCGACGPCLSGRMVHCTDTSGRERQRTRLTLDGQPVNQYLGISALAETMLVDASALIALPDALSFATGALLSCCVTTGLAAVFNDLNPAPGTSILVAGCGGVGIAAIQAARLAGCTTIIAVDPDAERLAASTFYGATHTIDPIMNDPAACAVDLTDGGVEYAVEAVGDPEAARSVFCALRPGGSAVVLGMMPAGADLVLPGRALRQGRRIAGSLMGSVRTPVDIPRFARLVQAGRIQVEPMITSAHPLAETNAALDAAAAPGGLRATISMRSLP
ncbi:alcohol dehydrogenase [Longispora fulva]|uniref:S-(Hydroxymethyl)glutathione dehydrogenase/alcohol dehydrogenase n=1 Tax=Longispora fulva TaxID=619741 RepID=A0A8J7KFK9_9ACTN|nr:alcohol dehydrogenase catalytic domain-containing protein [Longispora fulva]MBG6136320.1 S-(hydroxymethyl)glutathione dehydrogenase/alcohol dehydrogenase [Longispora fulva]GIG63171.1 alcohol dehydrogenase [Longispora fulva]